MTKDSSYSLVLTRVREKAIACGRNFDDMTVIAVSKNYSIESMQRVYYAGGRHFGEGRVLEAMKKIPFLPNDCRWHLIGTLQNNKVSKAISAFQLIHSVDHPKLARSISQASQKQGVITSILLQVNTSGETTKHGLQIKEWQLHLQEINQLPHLRIEGLMTMAPFTEDKTIIRSCFRRLYHLRERWRDQMKDPAVFQHLSMGMSHDYLIAIEEGATLLRIGTAIFG